ncbi:MAG: DUF58 domain-containing protein [Polyangiaceae bacterium]
MRPPSKLRRTIGWVVRAGRKVRDTFPMTAKGVLLLVGSALALLRYGLVHIDLLLLVVGGVGLGVAVLALLLVGPTALALALSMRKPPEGDAVILTTGIPTRTGFSIRNLWFVPLVTVEWSWTAPDAEVRTDKEAGRVREWIRPRRRALVTQVTRRFVVRDAWGLAEVTFHRTEPRSVRIVPAVGNLRNVPVVRALAGGDDFYDPLGTPQGDRADMRAYGPGDPVRLILWKVYAKSRDLVVRTPERARSPTRKTVAYVVAGPGDEPAAGAARAAVVNGALGVSWRLGADGCDSDATTADGAEELFARSGNAPLDDGGKDLTAFLARAGSESGPGTARAVVFVPPRPGPWMERVISAARAQKASPGSPAPMEILVCTDGVSKEPPRSWWSRIFTAPPPFDAARAAQRDLTAVTSALSAAHVPIALVDRAAGRVYHDAFRRMSPAASAPAAGAGKGSTPKESLPPPASPGASLPPPGDDAPKGGASSSSEAA